MQRPKVNVLIALFAYSGNGGIPGTIPELAVWLAETAVMLNKDERVGKVANMVLCDTPITMTRNQAVEAAQQGGFDMLLMLDSDNEPDGYFGKDPNAKRFMDVAFSFAYDRLTKGIPTVVAAPYCGPPPHPLAFGQSEGEVPYLFEWMNDSSHEEQTGIKLHRLNRNEAARMTGIQPVAALPTGVCLFTTNAFEGLAHPYFAYEFNEQHSKKNSTEDVYLTRNISLLWHDKIKQDVVFAACDSWALHHKVKKVGKPMLMSANAVHSDLRSRFLESVGVNPEGQACEIDFTDGNSVIKELGEQQPQNPIQSRVIGRRTIKTYFNQTPEEDLKALAEIVRQLGVKNAENIHPIEIVEVGSWVGESACAILQGLEMARAKGYVYCIDHWQGNASDWLGDVVEKYGSENVQKMFMDNLKQDIGNGSIRAIKGHSLDVADQIQANSQQVDLVFIDAGHTYEEVKADIEAWLPIVKQNGVLCGHDYCDAFPGVIQAVSERFGGEVKLVGSSVWMYVKESVDAPATSETV